MNTENIEQAIRKILSEELSNPQSATATNATVPGKNGIFKTVNEAIAATKAAQENYADQPISVRNKVIDAIREGFRPYIEDMAKRIHDETGMGTVSAKIAKLNNALYNSQKPKPVTVDWLCMNTRHLVSLVPLVLVPTPLKR